MDDILSYESTAERDDCISPVFGYSTGSSDTSVGFVYKDINTVKFVFLGSRTAVHKDRANSVLLYIHVCLCTIHARNLHHIYLPGVVQYGCRSLLYFYLS